MNVIGFPRKADPKKPVPTAEDLYQIAVETELPRIEAVLCHLQGVLEEQIDPGDYNDALSRRLDAVLDARVALEDVAKLAPERPTEGTAS